MNSRSLLPLLLAASLSAHARDLYVDPQTGLDNASGLAAQPGEKDGPVKTIARGLKLALAGDTVHLAKTVYHESAVFNNRAGEAEKPITLDGHGAVLEGSEPLDPAVWTETSPGLFQCDHLLPHDDAVIQRWFFLWDGKMNHMGRTSKGHRPDFKKPEDLKPGEWSYVKDTQNPPADHRFIRGTFYVKLPPGQKLADARIAAPMRSAGVQLSGNNQWLVIRNLVATHVYNDGYNIHQHCDHVAFENISAIECGDDGISAHETAEFTVDGLVSIRNSTGICDTGESSTHYRHVFIRDCLGFDVYFFQGGKHSITEGVVLSSSPHALSLNGNDGTRCSLKLDNVLFQGQTGLNDARVDKNAALETEHVTFQGISFIAAGGDIQMHETLIAPAPEKSGPAPSGHGANAAALLKMLVPK